MYYGYGAAIALFVISSLAARIFFNFLHSISKALATIGPLFDVANAVFASPPTSSGVGRLDCLLRHK